MNATRTIVLLALFVGAPAAMQAQEIPWQHDLNAAKASAKEQNRPLLLDFGTVNCYWCRQLDAITFRDLSIARLLTEKFVAVKIDAGKDPALAQSMGVNAFPTLIFLAPEGKLLGRHEGYADAGRLLPQLQTAAARCSASVMPNTAKPTVAMAPMMKFVLPTPQELGIGRMQYPEAPADHGAVFVRLREIGAVGLHLERVGSGFHARIDLPVSRNQGSAVEGDGPNEVAAISAAPAKLRSNLD